LECWLVLFNRIENKLEVGLFFFGYNCITIRVEYSTLVSCADG
jgi:hypothetical protein